MTDMNDLPKVLPANCRTYKNYRPVIGRDVYIDPTAVIIGQVTIADEASVWPMAVIRGDVNTIEIGARTNVQDGAVLHVSHHGNYRETGGELVIGEGVTIGHQGMIHACKIGDYCLIGMNSTIMDDVEIGAYTIIGAGALVTPGKKLESRAMYTGVPARKVRDLTEEEVQQLRYSADHYVREAAVYRAEMADNDTTGVSS